MARPRGHKLNRGAWDDWLAERGLSLTEVADMAEVPRPTLSSLLGGNHRASTPIAHKIASALRVQPVSLFPTLSPDFEESKHGGEKAA